ncbi:unnamed protein product [Closterium sp. Yama58-4]|nr:unnamed protein product [Closterium sp. Yama58-4]
MEPISAADKSAPTSADFPLRVQMGRGLSFTLEWNDYAVLRDQKKEFTERCFGLAIRFAWFDIGRDDLRLWVLGIGPLRSAMKAADHSCFAKAFDADIAAIPLKSTGGPLPGSHCSVIAILYPGDVLKAEGQVCRTSIRHIDPHTGKGKHRDEAVRVLKLFRTAALAELGRPGRKWDGAPPSQAVVEERLADCDDPIRDKVPGTVSDGHVGTGMLAATSFGWVAKQIGLLTGDKARSAVSIENIKVAGLRSLRDSMVDYICHRVAENRIAAPTSGADGPAEGAIDDDGAESQTAPSANDADAAQQRAADKQGLKRSGDGDDKESSKRSKGSDGSRVTKPPARSVVDMLKAKGWKVRGGSTSKGSGSGGADGRPADGIAANVDAPPGPPLDAEQTHPQASGGKDAAPTAQAAKVGGAGTTQGPSDAVPAKGKAMSASATVAGTGTAKAASASVPGTGKSKAASATVAGSTKSKAASGTVAGTTKSTPCNPPAATTGPAGQSGAGKHGEARAAPPAPAAPTAAKVDAKAASAQGPPGSNALRVLLHRMESHRPGAQQHPVVDAGLAETARRSVTPHVAGKPSDAQSAARPVAAPPPADPKSAFLRAHIGARKAAAPPVTQPEFGTSATPTAVNATAPSPGAAVVDLAAERGVSAALATGGRADRHAALESVLAQFEAAKRPEHAPALAIVDTAHAEPSATNTGGSAEPTAATGVVAEGNAGRKGKDDTGKGKAVSAGKEMAEDKGKKPARKTGGKGKSAKKKEEEEKEEEEEEEVGEGEEHGRRGHGIRRDRSGDGQGWVGEMKFKNQNRYIGKSRDKMELAYEHAIAYFVYDGYVSKVLMKELTALKPGELDEWKAVWEEVKILPTGMWTVMWARGLCHPRARFDDILGRFRGYAGSGDALHGVLWPAMWFPIIEDTEEGRAETNANMSAMVNRVSMCAAYGKVAARVAYGKVDGSAEATAGETTDMEGADRKADEKVQMGAQALAASACALWCYMSTPASVLGAVGEGKAAAILAGAGKERGEHFAMVMHVVIEHARTRQAPAGEVAHNVAPELQRYGVARAFEAGIEEDEADMIARATVETLAFWGMCPLDGPKLKAEGIDVPCDAKMEYDLDHRGRKGEKVKQAKGSKRKR